MLDSDDNDVDSSDSSSLDLSGLDEEEYTVEAHAQDSVGNWNNVSWTFTVDTTADFDLGLSSGDFDPEPGTIEMDGDQDVDVTLEDLSEDGTAYCNDQDGDEIDSADVSEDTDVEFTCEFDEDDYGATTTTVEIEVCDEVDNCATSDDMYDFSFDRYSPTVSNLETDSGASSFNSEFDVSFEVSDDVSDIDQVEYYFNTFVDPDEGTEFGYDEDTSTYSVDPSSLDSGEHTLKVRAQDEVGRWSDVTELDFSYYPDRTPSVALDVQENMTITAGESESLNVGVSNDGEIFIPSISVDVSGGFVSASQQIEELAPGDEVNPSFDIAPSEEDIGEYELTVSTDSPSAEQTVDLLVEANQDQREDINSTLQDYSQKLEELEQNVTELKSSGLAEERNRRLDSNFTAFKDKVEEADSAVAEGDYYRAEEILSGIDQQYSSAADTYKQVKKEEQKAQNRQMMLMALLGVVVLVSSGIGYIAYSDRYDLDLDAIEQKVQEVADVDTEELGSDSEGSALDGIKQKLSGLFEGGSSEAEEYSWQGFKEE